MPTASIPGQGKIEKGSDADALSRPVIGAQERHTKWTWRQAPELMARLNSAQNHPLNSNRDIMTFAGFCDSEAELERHVVWNENAIEFAS